MLVFEMLPAIRLPGLSAATFLASRSGATLIGWCGASMRGGREPGAA
jgi:hypothetical protein